MADQSIPTIQQKGVNVGIGTGNPLTQLHVNDGVNVSNLTMLTLSQLGNTGNRDVVNLKMSFNNGNTPGTMISAVKTVAAGSDMTFSTGAISNGALSEKMRITSAGNVGIGDNGPSSKLQVAGDVRISGAGTGIDGYDGGFLDYASSIFRIRGQNTTGGAISLMTSANGASNVSTERVRITSGGFVGIGDSSPAYKLGVYDSNQYVAGFVNTVANQLATVLVVNSAQSTAGVNTAAATFELVGKAGTSTHGRHAWIGAEGVAAETFRTKLLFKIRGESNSGYTWSGVTAAPTIVTMDGNGQVSFNQYTSASSFTGTAAGVLAFDSGGNIITQSATLYPSGSGTTNYVTKWTGANTLGNSQIIDNGTIVGVGSTTTVYGTVGKLLVRGSSATNATQQVYNDIDFAGGSNYTAPHLLVTSGASAALNNVTRLALAVYDGSQVYFDAICTEAGGGKSDLAIYTRNTGTPTEKMRITSTGNVGIGNTNNTYKLDVTGTGRFTSNLTSEGILYTTGGGTERQHQMLGYNSAYAVMRTNVGFNGNYNSLGFIVNSNDANNAQGNVTLPSWFMDLGGNTPNEDSVTISRSAPGSFSPSLLFKLSNGGAGTFTSTITATSATANNGSPHAGWFLSGNDGSTIWRAALAVQHNSDVTITTGASVGISFAPLASTGSNFYGSAAIKAVRPNATANNQDTDLAFWTRAGASNSTTDSEKMRITSGGGVGINTTVSSYGYLTLNGFTGLWLPYIDGISKSYNSGGIVVGSSNSANGNIGGGLTLVNNTASVGSYGPVIAWSSMTVNGAYNSTYAFITGIYQGAGGDNNWAVGDMIFGTASSYGAVERMRIKNSGDVGINTSVPNAILEVRGSNNTALNSRGNLFVADGGTATQTAGEGGQVSFGAWLNGDLSKPYPLGAIKGISESSATNVNTGALIFGTMNANTAVQERMRIDGEGKISQSLSTGAGAFGNGINIITSAGTYTAGHGGILQFQNEDVITGGIRAIRGGGSWGGSLLFYTHSTSVGNTFDTTFLERMRITEEGYVGIGTTNPGVRLQVNGDIVAGTYNNTRGLITSNGSFSEYYSTEGNPRWTISRDLIGGGEAGIGFNDNSGTIAASGAAIGGSANRTLKFYTSNGTVLTERMRLTSTGELWINYTADQGAYYLQVNGSVYATSYFESSDIRLKDVIATRNSTTFGAIQYKWKDGRDDKVHWGYAAQEVMKFIPDALKENNDGYYTLDYNQAHTYKIAMLEDRVAELELELKQLKNK